MIELAVVSDAAAGRRFHSDAALIRLGRQVGLEVVLVEPGVWETHAEIFRDATGAFVVRPMRQALVTINAQLTQEHRLRNGDIVGLGAVRLRFGIRPAPQRSLKVREAIIWAVTAGSALAGVAVMLGLGN